MYEKIEELKNCPFKMFQEMKESFLNKNIDIGVYINGYTRGLTNGNVGNFFLAIVSIIALVYPIVVGHWGLIFTFPIWFVVSSFGIVLALIYGMLIGGIFSSKYLLIFFISVAIIRLLYDASNNFVIMSITNLVINDESGFCKLGNAGLISIKDKSGKIFMNSIEK